MEGYNSIGDVTKDLNTNSDRLRSSKFALAIYRVEAHISSVVLQVVGSHEFYVT